MWALHVENRLLPEDFSHAEERFWLNEVNYNSLIDPILIKTCFPDVEIGGLVIVTQFL